MCECNGSGFVEVWPTDPLIPVRASFERCDGCVPLVFHTIEEYMAHYYPEPEPLPTRLAKQTLRRIEEALRR